MKTETKPGGFDWIGDIPAEWMVSRIKYVAVLYHERHFILSKKSANATYSL
jgi:hypothetical protein